MKNRASDTIAAIATPPGTGGIGIVRVSGSQVPFIIQSIIGKLPSPRQAIHANFNAADGSVIDEGIALFFQSPHSFTGEDVVEFQGHGGPVVLDSVLRRVLECGARLARPGEFSERAFLNGKIDLAQAEAIADLINAQSAQAAKCAMHSLQGEFSHYIHQLVEKLIHLRMYVEAALDFPEEDVNFLTDGKIESDLQAILRELEKVLVSAKQGRLLREGMTVVIVGKPNAGKSSLLNALSGYQSAIVTEIPGTTRDILREHIQIDGMPLHLLDTAGLRETTDIVEQEGVRRATAAMEQADKILLLCDITVPNNENEFSFSGKNVTTIYNKIDLIRKAPSLEQTEKGPLIYLSAKTGEGIDLLKQHLKQSMGFENNVEGNFIARRRHLAALQLAYHHLQTGQRHLSESQSGELLAEELLQAQNALADITGEFHNDDLLGKIFSEFCIGK